MPSISGEAVGLHAASDSENVEKCSPQKSERKGAGGEKQPAAVSVTHSASVSSLLKSERRFEAASAMSASVLPTSRGGERLATASVKGWDSKDTAGGRTSLTHPITVSPITKNGEPGKLGLCYCPGKNLVREVSHFRNCNTPLHHAGFLIH